jgi:carbonic anhydrase
LLGAEVIASIEYAVVILGVPLVAVLGHDGCGAIDAAITAHNDGGASLNGNLRTIVERLSPEIFMAKAKGSVDSTSVARLHVENTVDRLSEQSRPLRERIRDDRCAITGLAYNLIDGKVRILAARGLESPDIFGRELPSDV